MRDLSWDELGFYACGSFCLNVVFQFRVKLYN